MRKSKPILLLTSLVVLTSVFHFSSCTDNDNSLTEKETSIIDSLYKIRKKEMKGKLDTICDSVYNAQFPIFVDSIKAVRKKEILDLMDK